MWLECACVSAYISVIMSYIWVNKCHITMVISFHDNQLASCVCTDVSASVSRDRLRKSPETVSASVSGDCLSKSPETVSASLRRWSREIRALGDSQQTLVSVDKGTEGVTWCLV